MPLTELQKQIYARNIALAEVGESGQEKLLNASVLVIGNGGLGSPVLIYLAAMGIGHIGLCDGDSVSYTNLNRQVLYRIGDIGRSKSEVAAARLKSINPDLRVDIYKEFLTTENACDICRGYDIIVDCLDNFPTRLILNDACIELGIPFVHAGVYKYYGQTLTVIPGQGPCLRCVFPQDSIELMQDTAAQPSLDGIIGATPGIFGVMETLEVFKYLVGLPVNSNGFFHFDGLTMNGYRIEVEQDPDCICSKRKK
ncbi:MAG: HesA/MoeB/ThiF family protein [Bacillota bacterium]|jgi:molybdopterin/thiamine biosynthesis adenylyltransferase